MLPLSTEPPLFTLFDDISNIQNTGKTKNNMYLHSQHSQPHVISL